MIRTYPHPNRKLHSVSAPLRGFSTMNIVALVLCIISFGVMVASAFYFRAKNREYKIHVAQQQAMQADKLHFWEYKPVPVIEAQEYAREAMQSVEAFIRAQDVGGKAAATYNGYENVGRMNEYYSRHINEIIPREPALEKMGMLNVHGRDCLMIVVRFKNKTHWELSFFRDATEGRWKLDWPAFVRYQDIDWTQFVHGPDNVPDGARFRVWAMRDKTEENEDHYAVRFIGPTANGSSKQGVISPAVLVEKNSELGKEFYKYFRINELQNPVHRVLSAGDDKNYMRLRVVLSKDDSEDKTRKIFKLKKIIGEGWYSTPSQD